MTAQDRDYAERLFGRFRALPGSDEIATAYAIWGLVRLLRRRRPGMIVEIGGGIGTLSQALLHHAPGATLTVLERSAWCGARWQENVGGNPGAARTLKVTTWPDKPHQWPQRPVAVDLVVVDDVLPYRGVEPLLAHRALVFFEGNRGIERAILREGLRARGRPWAELNRRPWNRSKGFWLIRADAPLWQRVCWALATAAGRVLDLVVGPVLGVRPGWRRRDVNPHA